jgi:hypothetical protein
MFKKFRDRFIEDCRYWWKMWSSWLAILWGIVVTAVWNSPETLGQLLAVMPDEYRAWASPLVLAFVAGLPIFVRLLKQQKLEQALRDKADGEKK